MDVGLQMVFASYGWENVSDEQVWDEEIRLARLAADLGFDVLWSVEHHFNDYSFCPDNRQRYTWLRKPLAILLVGAASLGVVEDVAGAALVTETRPAHGGWLKSLDTWLIDERLDAAVAAPELIEVRDVERDEPTLPIAGLGALQGGRFLVTQRADDIAGVRRALDAHRLTESEAGYVSQSGIIDGVRHTGDAWWKHGARSDARLERRAQPLNHRRVGFRLRPLERPRATNEGVGEHPHISRWSEPGVFVRQSGARLLAGFRFHDDLDRLHADIRPLLDFKRSPHLDPLLIRDERVRRDCEESENRYSNIPPLKGLITLLAGFAAMSYGVYVGRIGARSGRHFAVGMVALAGGIALTWVGLDSVLTWSVRL